MRKKIYLFLLIVLLSTVNTSRAENFVFSDTFNVYSLGDIGGQGDWTVTKYYPDKIGSVEVTSESSDSDEKYVKVVNNDSILATRISTPTNVGILQFKMRHNKSGLFYLFAQTSDGGGQLLFSIQFTPSGEILLEEMGKQTALLSEYKENQWYYFTIDFDNTRKEHGAFTIQIDGRDYGEHAYVDSESTIFDLAQITLGSESGGVTAISGFGNGTSISQATTTATTTVSKGLLQLSIALATSSITANLDDGYIVTGTFDGIASSPQNGSSSATTSTETEESTPKSIGDFIVDFASNVIDIFTPANNPEPVLETPTSNIPEVIQIESPTADNKEIKNELQSSLPIDTTHDEVVTTTF